MKKREIIIVALVAVVALLAVVFLKRPQKPEEEPKTLVAIQHGNNIVKEFDPTVDAIYEVTGDYGKMNIEVKDGKWHVSEVECPNHICEAMGWVDVTEIIPITCLPNNIIIYVEEQE